MPVTNAAIQSGIECPSAKAMLTAQKRERGKFSERNMGELFVDQIAQKKTAPEDFFDKGNDNDKARKSQNDGEPEKQRLLREGVRIKPDESRRSTEKGLRRNPEHEDNDANGENKERLSQFPEFIFVPEEKNDGAAEQRLERKIQYSGEVSQNGPPIFFTLAADREQPQKERHGQDVAD